jgi:lipopolysaccharide transport system ATP-binding protein
MSFDIAIKVENLSKSYQIYEKPQDRLKQSIFPRLNQLFGKGSKQYFQEFSALKDVSFEVKRGETVGIIGRNGSGKSTLLQMICGTLNPTQGSIQVNGRVAALLELGAGFNAEFTGRENIYTNGALLGLSKDEIEHKLGGILAFADIGIFIDQPIKTYSSGMLVRLAFAVIAHVDADVLIIDEALAVGDAFFTQKCMRYLRTFMNTGTILFVSHDTASINNLCNRALWLDKGELLQEGLPKDVCASYLEAFYEEYQGKSSEPKAQPLESRSVEVKLRDQRLEFINNSNFRNDLELFKFNPDASSFGKGGAQIIDVQLLDKNSHPLSWVVGGEKIAIRVDAAVHNELNSPIIGFYVKDRLGQTLFGDNTFLSYRESPLSCQSESRLSAEFTFSMPILPAGDYSIAVALANGTQEVHEQHHWIHDAILFKSHSSSVSTGIIGIPMLNITLETSE